MLRMPRAIMDGIHEHAREGAPDEVCGVLAGSSEGAAHNVERAFRVRNASPRARREYLLDPEEQLRIVLDVEDTLGLAIVGFYHSHPDGPAMFSATDAARASWPGASYLLVHLAPTVGERSARFDGSRLVDEQLEIIPSGTSSPDRG